MSRKAAAIPFLLVLAVLAQQSTPVAIPPPSGNPSFQPAVTYSLRDGESNSAAVADINRDGKPDIIILSGEGSTNDDGFVNILLGKGDGSFQAPTLLDSGGHFPTSVAVADLNGDGKLDLVVANCSGPTGTALQCPNPVDSVIAIFLGNGNGTFQSPIVFDAGGTGTGQILIADLNADRKPDLILANQGQGAIVFLGNGDGTFLAPSGPWGEGGLAMSLADFNGDGKPDLVMLTGGSNNEEAVADVLLGNGNGSFQTPVSYRVPGVLGANGIAVADLNADGKIDFVAVGTNANLQGRVGVLLGRGDGTFTSGKSYGTGGFDQVFSVAIADMNGDGVPDLVVGNCAQSDCVTPDGVVSVLTGTGHGTFQGPATYDGGPSSARFVTTADLNGDGRPDIVVAHFFTFNALTLLLNTTTPFAFPTSTSLTSSLNPSTYGQNVILTARVTGTGPVPPTGNVTFRSSATNIGSATLNANGVGTLTKSDLNVGTSRLTALYEGDANNVSSTSPLLSQVVKKAPSSATLTSSPNPSNFGQIVTFTAKITAQTGTPTGSVTFKTGTTALGTVVLSNGMATLSTSSLPSGSNVVSATYSGDSKIKGSYAQIKQVVQ